MHHREGVVRMADQREQPPHPSQAERPIAPGTGWYLAFVIHP
jgi:hypothetical protein